jgi:hypothetical protein
MNWLANLTGKINGFKEKDLLQEHQNFWAKVYLLLAIFPYKIVNHIYNR